MKVLSACQYDGEYDGKKYSKVMLVVSENGQYPKLIGIDPRLWNEAGGKLVGREINVLYEQSYGKFRASKLQIVE